VSFQADPVGLPTYPVWTYYASPDKAQQYPAHGAALVLLVLVPIVIVLGRVAVAISRRHAE
jgi:ABC-type phosphate transport system permease subunit